MIAVDTNVLVRYVTNDDPVQAARAFELLKHARDVFVPKTVVLETEWVLRAVYGLPRENVRNALLHVLGLPNVVVEDAERVAEAIDLYDGGMDLADALHLSSSSDADEFFTFDRRFERLARGLGRPVRLL
ncbi:MAG: type II toxin-antitoxin system VapC family toxin [Candidatus Dadabacteria bacterium]|nr:MAG: type II toxin-antitoxin system VapC family toxin [Candidatus Dadabacteria bacterium]